MTATFSPCGRYRYALTREWLGDGPTDLWIMLNPSTADATQDDPTIRRCIGFSTRWGASGLAVVNLYALRSTDPAAPLTDPEPVGPDNDEAIGTLALSAWAGGGRIVCAWGAHPAAPARALDVVEGLRGMGPVCLGTTRSGAPRHPLYVPGSTAPVEYTP